MKNKLYIAYGSNLNLKQMASRCPNAKVIGASELENWRLLFCGAHENAVATIQPFEGDSVPVLLWRITPSDEAALDRYEGYPFLYRKETLELSLKGKTISAMVYIMNEGRPVGSPSPYYYTTILDGYKTAGFDENVLRKATEGSRKCP